MGRPKGSKNKKTLLKEAIQNANKQAAIETSIAPIVPETTNIVINIERKPEYEGLWKLTVHRMELIRSYYNAPAIEDKYFNKADRVFLATNPLDAEKTSKDVVDLYHFHVMHLWLKERIPGPNAQVSSLKQEIANYKRLIGRLVNKEGMATKIEEYEKEIQRLEASLETTETPQTPWNQTGWENYG